VVVKAPADGIVAHYSCAFSQALPIPTAKVPSTFENKSFSLRLFLQQWMSHRWCNVACFMCETWSVTLREEHRLRVFENRVLRGIFGPNKEEVTGDWSKFHSERPCL
jgi:hypothetical protein